MGDLLGGRLDVGQAIVRHAPAGSTDEVVMSVGPSIVERGPLVEMDLLDEAVVSEISQAVVDRRVGDVGQVIADAVIDIGRRQVAIGPIDGAQDGCSLWRKPQFIGHGQCIGHSNLIPILD